MLLAYNTGEMQELARTYTMSLPISQHHTVSIRKESHKYRSVGHGLKDMPRDIIIEVRDVFERPKGHADE